MGLHGGIAGFDVRRQIDDDRRHLLALLAAVLERQTHRVGMRHAALQRVDDRCLELGGPIAIQESQLGSRDGSEIVTRLCGA